MYWKTPKMPLQDAGALEAIQTLKRRSWVIVALARGILEAIWKVETGSRGTIL